MKLAEKTTKIADRAEQNLPVSADSPGTEEIPAGDRRVVEPESENGGPKSDLSIAVSSTSPVARPAAASGGPDVAAAVSGVNDTKWHALERTHETIAAHALHLRQADADRLRVVIEPGGGLRLALELRRGQDGIDARAELRGADAQWLSRHWGELQQRLEQRGVHLAPLPAEPALSGHSQSSYRSPADHSTGEEQTHRAHLDSPIIARMGEFQDRPAIRGRGLGLRSNDRWESWA